MLAATLPSRHGARHHRVDYLGAALLAAGLSALVLALTLGGTSYAWGSPLIIGLGVAAVVLLGVFMVVERRAAEPVLPPRLFANRVFASTSGSASWSGSRCSARSPTCRCSCRSSRGASPTSSGLQILPLMGGLLVTSIGSGQIITRTGHYKAVSDRRHGGDGRSACYLLSRMTPRPRRLEASPFMFVLGLGIGW